jgi:hypothetical protein
MGVALPLEGNSVTANWFASLNLCFSDIVHHLYCVGFSDTMVI